MTKPYIDPTERNPRGEIDLARFAADLAKELNGKIVTKGEYPHEHQQISIEQKDVGFNVLLLRADNWKKKVHIGIETAEIKWDDRNTYATDHRAEGASISPDARTIQAIAKDITKRVIDPSLPALGKQREYAAQKAKNRNGIATYAQQLSKALPDYTVRRKDAKAEQASIYSGSAPHYISGTLNCDNTVSIERISSIPADKFIAIAKILNGSA